MMTDNYGMLANLLREFNVPLDNHTARNALINEGVLTMLSRKSTTSIFPKYFYILSADGLEYGVNIPTDHPAQHVARYYRETFQKLIDEVLSKYIT